MLEWCFSLFQDVSKWGQIVEIPIIINKPSCFNQWYIFFGHTDSLCHLHTFLIHGNHALVVVLLVNLEDVSVLVVVTSVSRLLFLSPQLNDTASSRLTREQEVIVFQTAVSETLCIRGNILSACRPLVDVTQFPVILGAGSELFTQLSERNIVYLAKNRHVPTSKISHIVVDEEIVWLHIVSPTILLAVSPTIRLAMCDETANQKLLHRSGIHLCHTIELHITLQYRTHSFSQLLFVPVSCRTGRLFHLATINTEHALYQPAYKVVFERHITLTLDVLLLGHSLAVNANLVVPLETIRVTLVAFPVPTEVLHLVPIVLRLHKNVKRPTVAKLT